MGTESRRGETGIGRGLFVIAALLAVTLTASAPVAAQSKDGSANEGAPHTNVESQYNTQGSPGCPPGQCAPVTAEGPPSLADVPREAGSSGSRSFRGFSQTLGGGGSTGIPPAAAAENTGTSRPSSDMGPDPAANDGNSESVAGGDAKPEPKKNAKSGALTETGGLPLSALGALAALVALVSGGLLIRRIAR